MKIYEIINYGHSLFSIYLMFGWSISEIHCKSLMLLIPMGYLNYLLDDNKCFLTRLEQYYKKQYNIIDEKDFISSKLEKINININKKILDKIIYIRYLSNWSLLFLEYLHRNFYFCGKCQDECPQKFLKDMCLSLVNRNHFDETV